MRYKLWNLTITILIRKFALYIESRHEDSHLKTVHYLHTFIKYVILSKYPRHRFLKNIESRLYPWVISLLQTAFVFRNTHKLYKFIRLLLHFSDYNVWPRFRHASIIPVKREWGGSYNYGMYCTSPYVLYIALCTVHRLMYTTSPYVVYNTQLFYYEIHLESLQWKFDEMGLMTSIFCLVLWV